MYIMNESNPKNSLYYQGARILKLLRVKPNLTINEIHHELNNDNNKVTIQIVSLTLGWLYLIDSIQASNEGVITYVSK